MRALIAGWFSFVGMGATAGDLLSRDVVCDWLEQEQIPYDIAVALPFTGGIDWQEADPSSYTHVIFICGPFGNGEPIVSFLNHFQGCRLIGLNLSMLQSLDEWNPFDLLIERDSTAAVRPDISFLSNAPRVPVVGLLLVHPQSEYRNRGRHEHVHALIHQMLEDLDAAIVPIDTRLDINSGGLRTPAEIESLIAKMDLVVTTRLHGTVLALKNGVPAVVVDPISGGAKITSQAQEIGWPVVFEADTVTIADLRTAFDYCVTHEAKLMAEGIRGKACLQLEDIQSSVLVCLAQ